MRLGKLGSVLALGALALIVLMIVSTVIYLWVRRSRARARQAEALEIKLNTPWMAFSRPDLRNNGNTWNVGVERVTRQGDDISPKVYVLRGHPADDHAAILEAEGEAYAMATRYTEAKAR